MIEKCANPSCSRPFRRLGRGRVYAFETRPTATVCAVKSTKTWFLWLCEACTLNHKVVIDAAGNLKVDSNLPALRISTDGGLRNAAEEKIA